MAKSKIFDFFSDLTSRGNPKEDINISDIGRNLKLSSHRASQKLLSYEIEILEGHLQKEHQYLGEMMYNLLQQGKKVGKTTQELQPIFKVIDELNLKLKQKINDKNLGLSFLDKAKTSKVKNKVKSKINKPKLSKATSVNSKSKKRASKRVVKK